jgi:hypothetical protein
MGEEQAAEHVKIEKAGGTCRAREKGMHDILELEVHCRVTNDGDHCYRIVEARLDDFLADKKPQGPPIELAPEDETLNPCASVGVKGSGRIVLKDTNLHPRGHDPAEAPPFTARTCVKLAYKGKVYPVSAEVRREDFDQRP